MCKNLLFQISTGVFLHQQEVEPRCTRCDCSCSTVALHRWQTLGLHVFCCCHKHSCRASRDAEIGMFKYLHLYFSCFCGWWIFYACVFPGWKEKFWRGQDSLLGLIKKTPTVGSRISVLPVWVTNSALIEQLLVQKIKWRVLLFTQWWLLEQFQVKGSVWCWFWSGTREWSQKWWGVKAVHLCKWIHLSAGAVWFLFAGVCILKATFMLVVL